MKVQQVNKANALKQSVKRLLANIDTSQFKKGYVHHNAFFEILELNGIRLKEKDKLQLFKLHRETKPISIEKDSHGLINFKQALSNIFIDQESMFPFQA